MRRRRVEPLPFLVPALRMVLGRAPLVPVPVPVVSGPGGRWGGPSGRGAAVRAASARRAGSR